MAEVIKGIFPQKKTPAKKDEKPAPSYILHVAIVFSDPLIWRRIQVPGSYSLAQLHRVIQRSMGWSDTHVHQFLIGKISYEPTMGEAGIRESKRFDEEKYKLHALEESMRFMFTYFYDAGQGWEHEITLEEIVPPEPPLYRPLILAGERACPPETVDDIHAYQELLAHPSPPGSKAKHRLRDLAGPDFAPEVFDLDAAEKRLADLNQQSFSS